MKQPAKIFLENYNKVLYEENSYLLSKLEKKNIDPPYVFNTYRDGELKAKYAKVENDCKPYGFKYIHAVEDLMRGEGYPIEKAINEVFKTEPPENLQDLLIKNSTLKAFNDFHAYDVYYKFLKDNRISKTGNEVAHFNENIYWKGKNVTEFVQLVYALFEAKLLTNDKDEVTNLVKQLARLFNIDLGDNWPSNLSKSISERHYYDEPEIFAKIKAGYKAYYDKIMNKE